VWTAWKKSGRREFSSFVSFEAHPEDLQKEVYKTGRFSFLSVSAVRSTCMHQAFYAYVKTARSYQYARTYFSLFTKKFKWLNNGVPYFICVLFLSMNSNATVSRCWSHTSLNSNVAYLLVLFFIGVSKHIVNCLSPFPTNSKCLGNPWPSSSWWLHIPYSVRKLHLN
jgi:hypothetical protein